MTLLFQKFLFKLFKRNKKIEKYIENKRFLFKLLSMQLNKLRKLKNSILEQNVLIAANLLKNVKNLVFIWNEV